MHIHVLLAFLFSQILPHPSFAGIGASPGNTNIPQRFLDQLTDLIALQQTLQEIEDNSPLYPLPLEDKNPPQRAVPLFEFEFETTATWSTTTPLPYGVGTLVPNKWPCPIPYFIHESIKEPQLIQDAIEYFTTVTKWTMLEITECEYESSPGDAIQFVDATSCWSYKLGPSLSLSQTDYALNTRIQFVAHAQENRMIIS